MNIARITLYLINMRGNEPVARTHGAKHRDYFFFKDPASTRYRRVYEEGNEPDPARGRWPLDLEKVNADIDDISMSGEIKDIGLRVVFETAEQVEAERQRIEAARVAAELAQKQLAEKLEAQEQALKDAQEETDALQRGVNERVPSEKPAEPSTEAPAPKKRATIRTGKPLNIGE